MFVRKIKEQAYFIFAVLPFLLGAIVTRAPFFLHYTVPGFGKDTYSYYKPLMDMANGVLPVFDMRTPGYTIFLGILELFNPSALGIITVQCLICLASCLYLLKVIRNNFGFPEFVLSSVALLVFYCSADIVRFDTSVLTEGLYTYSIILTLAFIVKVVMHPNRWTALLLSFTVSAMVLIRPQGLFFVPILALVVAFSYYRSRDLGIGASIVVPFSVIMLVFFSYNLKTFGNFSFSAFGPVNRLGTQVTYMETSEEYHPEVNKLIERIHKNLPEGVTEKVHRSWSYEDLKPAFSVHDSSLRMMFELQNKLDLSYYETSKVLQEVSDDAKDGNTVLYLKFIATSIIGFHGNLLESRHFFFNELHNRCLFFGDGSMRNFRSDESVRFNFKEFAQYVDGENIVPGCTEILSPSYFSDIFPSEQILVKVSHYFSLVSNLAFRNILWIILPALIYLFSIFRFVASGFTDQFAFVIFTIGSIVILSSILVGLVQLPFNRYSAPTEFVYYLAVALSPSLIRLKNE